MRFEQTAGLDDSWKKKGGPPGRTSSAATATAGHTSARQRAATEKETKSQISGSVMAVMSFKRGGLNQDFANRRRFGQTQRGVRARAHVPNGKYHGVEKMKQILKLRKKITCCDFTQTCVERRICQRFILGFFLYSNKHEKMKKKR